MIVQRFVRWCATATAQQRCEGVEILARAFVEGRVPPDERGEAHDALFFALDDPSPKVRMALAGTLARSPAAPRAIVLALVEDIEEIARLVASQSPVLGDSELVDLAASGTCTLQCAIAGRTHVSLRLSAALAEIAGPGACSVLMANEGAEISGTSHRRIAERHGEDDGLRALMLDRPDLPPQVRQILTLHLAEALSRLAFLRNCLGAERSDRLVAEACERATAILAADVLPEEIGGFVEHLRVSGQISTAFLIRMACAGHIDVFAATIVALSGTSERRVRAIIVEGRPHAFNALIAACGLPKGAAEVLRAAMQLWKRAVATGFERPAETIAGNVMSQLVQRFAGRRDEDGFLSIFAMLSRLESETARQSARRQVRMLAAA